MLQFDFEVFEIERTYDNCIAVLETLGDTHKSYSADIFLRLRTVDHIRLWKKIKRLINEVVYNESKKFPITLTVGNFLKGSGLLVALDPISRVTDHREFLRTTGEGETSVAGRDTFFFVANNS
jgi:hypothetical protein